MSAVWGRKELESLQAWLSEAPMENALIVDLETEQPDGQSKPDMRTASITQVGPAGV